MTHRARFIGVAHWAVRRRRSTEACLEVDGSVQAPVAWEYIAVSGTSGSTPPSRADRIDALPGLFSGDRGARFSNQASIKPGKAERMANKNSPLTTDTTMEQPSCP